MRTRSIRICRPSIILALAAGVVAAAQPATAPTTAPTTAAAQAPPSPPLDPAIDAILTRLEQRRVQDLHARLTWRQEFAVDEPDEVVSKRGELWYQQADPVARFLIHFKEWIKGTEKRPLDERHLFDGCWYVEVQSQTKTVQRREVRRPEDAGDPYKVGEGVFPLPFGQKKDDIVREFEVALLPPAADDPKDTEHLRLTPRAGTRTGQNYKELDFWVQRGGATDGLPVKVRVAKLDGTGKLNSHITITFGDAELNKGLRDGLFEIKTPTGYTELVERLEPIPVPPTPTPAGAGR